MTRAQIAALAVHHQSAREALEVAEDAVGACRDRVGCEGVHAFAYGMRLALDALDEAERRYYAIRGTLEVAGVLDDVMKYQRDERAA